jgi:uncharacterized protein YndB with AHSA1/START domain
MPDILHRIAVKSSRNETHRALGTREGLARWWTTDTSGQGQVGGTLQFRFGERGGFDMKVLENEPAKRVLWQVVSGPADWLGTKISFELRSEQDYTVVLFEHRGWREPSEFMHHCSTKWATFLMSCKQLLEQGKGAPYPEDVHISETD